MTAAVFRRVLWKEYRVLRAFWIVVALIVIATQAIAWTYTQGGEAQRAFYAIFAFAVTLYALAAGALLFAVEREEETGSFLLALPVDSRWLFAAKTTLAIVSTLALTAFLMAVILLWKSWGLLGDSVTSTSWDQGRPDGLLAFGAVALDVFVCGLFCSLLMKRPLVAACVGAALAMLLMYIATLLTSLLTNPQYHPEDFGYGWSIAVLALSACVFTLDVGLGQRWLEIDSLNDLLRRRSKKRTTLVAEPAVVRTSYRPRLRMVFGRLAWQEFRQAWRMMAIYLGIGALLAAWIAAGGNRDEEQTFAAMLVTAAVAAIMGASTFYADQERSQYRFFAERPVRPRMVWLNRQVMWFTVIAAFLVVATPLWVAVVFRGDLSPLWEPFIRSQMGQSQAAKLTGTIFELPGGVTFAVMVLLAYSCGQLSSMVLRSGIVAGFLAIALTIVVVAWSALMGAIEVMWLLSIAPLPLIMLWATWLRAPHWIAERSDWRSWTRLGLSLAVPTLAVGVATASFRMFEIPRVDPGFSPEQYMAQVTPAARETAQMYLRAAETVDSGLWARYGDPTLGRGDHLAADLAGLVPYDNSGNPEARQDWIKSWAIPRTKTMFAWLAANQEPLRLALEATERPSCAFRLSGRDLRTVAVLEELIGTEARRRELAGDFNGMLDCELALLRMSSHMSEHQFRGDGRQVERRTLEVLSPYWVTRPGQTPALLRRAIAEIQKWQSGVPTPIDSIKAAYLWDQRLVELDPEALSEEGEQNIHLGSNLPRYIFMHYVMPWEAYRARRALNFVTAQEISSVQAVIDAAKAGEATSRLAAKVRSYNQNPVVQSTPWLSLGRHGFWLDGATFWLETLTRQNATLLIFALEAYRLEHGALPETLDALAGDYFQELPKDPFAGMNFQYLPHGSPSGFSRYGFAPHVPVLWSCGQGLLPVTRGLGDEEVYLQIGWDATAIGSRAPFSVLYERGMPIEIPHPGSDESPNTEGASDEKPAESDEAPADDHDAAPAPPAPDAPPDDNTFPDPL